MLMDAEERLFETRRFCFLGSIDDWMTIGDQDALHMLVKTYVQHLGEDSFLRIIVDIKFSVICLFVISHFRFVDMEERIAPIHQRVLVKHDERWQDDEQNQIVLSHFH